MGNNVVFHPAQDEVARDRHRFRVLDAGRRFGKTELAVFEMLGKACAKTGNDVVYIAPTYQQARDLAWDKLKSYGRPVAERINESRLEIVVATKDGGSSRIVLRGWESIDTLRGLRVSFVVMDEVAMMRGFWQNWQEVVRPTLTDLKGEALFISTPRGFNHFYDLYCMEGKDPDFKSFRFTTYDNPHIPKDEVDKARMELTEDRFAQEYLGDFRKMEGLVYKEFDRKKHVFTEMPKNVAETICGVDFGFSNPCAALKIQIDNDGCWWVVDEFYRRGKTNQEIIEYVRTFGASEYYPDPAEPDRIEEMSRAGLPVREVNKDVAAGIDAVRNLLRRGKLKVHADCLNTLFEFETYAYRTKGLKEGQSEEPFKENDHAMDALRYAIFMRAPKTPRVHVEETPFVFNPPSY